MNKDIIKFEKDFIRKLSNTFNIKKEYIKLKFKRKRKLRYKIQKIKIYIKNIYFGHFYTSIVSCRNYEIYDFTILEKKFKKCIICKLRKK